MSGGAASAQDGPGGRVLHEADGFRLSAGVELGVQLVTESNAFWNLEDTFTPGEPFDSDPTWAEGYLKPALDMTVALAGDADLYGRLSAIGAYSRGTDAFAAENSGRLLLEDAFLGLRIGRQGTGPFFDVSLGAQPHKLGSGMLIADGGGDGFERGALIFGPRRAFEFAAISRIGFDDAALEVFYLDANELASSDTGTTLAGGALTQGFGSGSRLGLGAGAVVESEAAWPAAPAGGVGVPQILPGAREGMAFVNAWGTWKPSEAATIEADFAMQRDDDPDQRAYGGRVRASWSFTGSGFSPVLSYSFLAFSGDDPDTGRIERFDPLFYDGGPTAWASGANASLAFVNSNLMAHQIAVSLTLSPRDFLTGRYYHVRAMETGSPLQFGQATRVGNAGSGRALVTGVDDAHLADDLYIEYTRLVTEAVFFTGGVGVSFPGAGVRNLRDGRNDLWTGAFANIVVRY